MVVGSRERNVLMMGPRESGKTSMRAMVFNGMQAVETHGLGMTVNRAQDTARFCDDVVLKLTEVGGQEGYFEGFYRTAAFFRDLAALVFVADADPFAVAMDAHQWAQPAGAPPDMETCAAEVLAAVRSGQRKHPRLEQALDWFRRACRQTAAHSPDAALFLIVSRIDLVAKERDPARPARVLDLARRLMLGALDGPEFAAAPTDGPDGPADQAASGVPPDADGAGAVEAPAAADPLAPRVRLLQTSIHEPSLLLAWGEIVRALLPDGPRLVGRLREWVRQGAAAVGDAAEVLVLEATTMLEVARVSVPPPGAAPADPVDESAGGLAAGAAAGGPAALPEASLQKALRDFQLACRADASLREAVIEAPGACIAVRPLDHSKVLVFATRGGCSPALTAAAADALLRWYNAAA